MPYEVRRYERSKSLAAPPELKRVHPLGKSPVITEGDLTLAETGAIVTYIAEPTAADVSSPSRTRPTGGGCSTSCTTPKARPCHRF